MEIYSTVFSINAESTPGPDGFTALFFKKNWEIVKDQICKEILGFFRQGSFLKSGITLTCACFQRFQIHKECQILDQSAYVQSYIRLFPKSCLSD